MSPLHSTCFDGGHGDSHGRVREDESVSKHEDASHSHDDAGHSHDDAGHSHDDAGHSGEDTGHSCDAAHGERAGQTRRMVLAGTAAIGVTAVAGCLGDDRAGTPAAVAVSADATCDECGMVIANHPGPNAELYWADVDPDGHDAPFWFDALKQCFFPHHFEGVDAGRTLEAAYVTDYSAVDYTVATEDGESYITSHTEADAFGPAADLWYVVESDVTGAMGPDFVPFSDEGDAGAFADEYGGSVIEFDDVTPALAGK